MFTINNFTKKSEQCQFCHSYQLQSIGTQNYCQQCHSATNQIEHQLKVVPCSYRSNADKQFNSAQLKIRQYLASLSLQFGIIGDGDLLDYLCLQVKLLKTILGKYSKGNYDSAAVVVFCHFKENSNTQLRQFCLKNQIKIKSFNKKYILYMKNNTTRKQIKSQQLKQELKIEEIKEQQSKQDYNDREYEDKHQHNYTILFYQQMIEKVFDDLFSKYYYLSHRNNIVHGLIQRIVEGYKCMLNYIKHTNLEYQNLLRVLRTRIHVFYMIYVIIKKLNHKITLKKYQQIVRDKTGLKLKINHYYRIKNLYHKILSNSYLQQMTQSHQNLTESCLKQQQWVQS